MGKSQKWVDVQFAFEELAKRTWKTLEKSYKLKMSISEETLTDLNLLELEYEHFSNIRIRKINKKEESKIGCDWEMWIAYSDDCVFRYSIQAKKVDFLNRYKNLWHSAGSDGELQINLLEEFANANNSIPLYCFFNFVDNVEERSWHCGFDFDKYQLGCTVTHLSTIKNLLGERNANTFARIHNENKTLPLSCLVKCPNLLNTGGHTGFHPLFEGGNSRAGFYSSVPWFFDSQELVISDIENYYSRETATYPRFLVLVDLRNQ